MAVGLPAKTTYVDGDVFSASDINDTNGTINLVGQTNNFYAAKNKIINGDFFVNQRGFTSSTTNTAFTFDRFNINATDGTSTFTAQTFTLGSEPLVGSNAVNYMQIATTGQTLTTALSSLAQKVENVRTYAGETVTMSFWARATSGTPNITAFAAQNFGSGGSSLVFTGSTKKAITTTWARYSFNIAVPSITGKTVGAGNHVRFDVCVSAGSARNAYTDSLGIQTGTFEVWGIQVEAGLVATAFQTATGTIQGELAACQRYFSRLISGTQKVGAMATGSSTTAAFFAIPLIVEMRSAPSLTVSAAGHFGFAGIAVNTVITLDSTRTTSKVALVDGTIGAASLVARSGYLFVSDSASATFDLSAEL
jgi:hypothetical protein